MSTVEPYPFNDEFTSDNPTIVRRFYDHFQSAKELVSWMRNRPGGRALISEVEGSTDAVVVIPTSDVHGSLAINCRERVFKGQHIVFVESGGRSDKLFNIARNTNIGVRRALEYNPNWLIVAGDDAIGIDPIIRLTDGLGKLDPRATTIVYPTPFGSYHSVQSSLVRIKEWSRPLLRLRRYEVRQIYELHQRFGVEYEFMGDLVFRGGMRRLLNGPFLRKVAHYVDVVSFGVFSSCYVHELDGKLFDPTYINHCEESVLSFRTWERGKGIRFVPFRIADAAGETLGRGHARALRGVASKCYFNYQVQEGSFKLASSILGA